MKEEKIEKYIQKLNDIAGKVAKADQTSPTMSAFLALMETISLFNEIYEEGYDDGRADGIEEGKKVERIKMEKEQTKLN